MCDQALPYARKNSARPAPEIEAENTNVNQHYRIYLDGTHGAVRPRSPCRLYTVARRRLAASRAPGARVGPTRGRPHARKPRTRRTHQHHRTKRARTCTCNATPRDNKRRTRETRITSLAKLNHLRTHNRVHPLRLSASAAGHARNGGDAHTQTVAQNEFARPPRAAEHTPRAVAHAGRRPSTAHPPTRGSNLARPLPFPDAIRIPSRRNALTPHPR